MGCRRMQQRCLMALLLGCAAAFVSSQPLLPPPPPPSPPAAFGTTAANTSETTELSQLTVAAVESGSSGQPQLVRQAFLASVNATASAAGGAQTAGFGGFPWTTNTTFPGRKDPNELTSSAEGIVESDGTVPQCEVTVQLSAPYNTTGGLVATVLNLIFTNWDSTDVVSPWSLTIINSAYRNLVDSFNIDVTIAVQRIIQGTVNAGTVPSNGRSSVPITLIVEADAGADLSPQSIFQNGRKCILVNVGGAAFPAAPGAGDGGAEAAEKPVRLLGPQIIGVDGNALQLKGVNWFGFDDGITMPEGLWADGGKLQRDLATITQRIRLLGFNAVRLPFSMKDLFNLSPKSCTATCKTVTSAQVLQSVTRPSTGRRLLQDAQPGTCGDVPPTTEFTCEQELALGLCSEPFMKGFCNLSCGRCSAEGICTDDAPSTDYTCAEQKVFGKCDAAFMKGFCNKSCGRCAAATGNIACADVRVPGNFTCAQQRDFGKCGADFMVGFCDATCGRCTTTRQDTAGVEAACVDVPPPAGTGTKYTCAQQKSFGKCSAAFMAGYCKVTCGRCATPAVATPKPTPKPATCTDVAPSKDFTCAQQKAFGKCNQAFMKGYCNKSCSRCGSTAASTTAAPKPPATCADVAPSKDFTCAQQKAFGKCNQAFMKGFCNSSCGRCPAATSTTSRVAAPVATLAPAPRQTSKISVELPAPPTGGNSGICNSYLPSDSVFNRFMYVVQFLTRNGFYVLLDNQINFDTTAVDNTAGWLHGWTRIAKAVNADSRVANRVIYDVLNEPDAFGLAFEPKGGKPGMRDLYLKSFDAIYAVNPASIMMIEGLGQQNYGSLNWGDGLITDPATIANKKLSDPNLFFQQLLKKPYRRQIIVGVHVYPPSISKSTRENNAGNGLYPRLSLCHGYLNKRGYCFNGDCQVFPVVYGEWGSALKDSRDITWLNDMIAYMNNVGAGNDGLHNAIGSWFWWSWNMNSGDTGGILYTDWLGIRWDKMSYLERVGLTPWDRRAAS